MIQSVSVVICEICVENDLAVRMGNYDRSLCPLWFSSGDIVKNLTKKLDKDM